MVGLNFNFVEVKSALAVFNQFFVFIIGYPLNMFIYCLFQYFYTKLT